MSGRDEETPLPPPERVRSSPGAEREERSPPEDAATGPVPVRDLMRPAATGEEAGAEGGHEPAWRGIEHGFEREGTEWIARSAGAGTYGTGRLGAARLTAVHFYRREDPGTPVREALVAAGAFPDMGPAELRSLFERATPIELER